MPYDLIFDVNNLLLKIQVKSAWYDEGRKNFVVDTRRTKTNRRQMIRQNYSPTDFDFAVIYIQELDVFYIIPSDVFISYGSELHLVEADKRQKKTAFCGIPRCLAVNFRKGYSESNFGMKICQIRGSLKSVVIPSQDPNFFIG